MIFAAVFIGFILGSSINFIGGIIAACGFGLLAWALSGFKVKNNMADDKQHTDLPQVFNGNYEKAYQLAESDYKILVDRLKAQPNDSMLQKKINDQEILMDEILVEHMRQLTILAQKSMDETLVPIYMRSITLRKQGLTKDKALKQAEEEFLFEKQLKISQSPHSEEDSHANLISSAEMGDAEAQHKLATYYQKKTPNSIEDQTTALKWFRLAADQKHSQSLISLGHIYDQDKNISKNEIIAYSIFGYHESLYPQAIGRVYRSAIQDFLNIDEIDEGNKLTLSMKDIGLLKAIDALT